MKTRNRLIIGLFFLVLASMLILSGCGDTGSSGGGPAVSTVITTVQQQILPVAIAPNTPEITPAEVALYAVYGYSAWRNGPGLAVEKRYDLAPDYNGAANTARLLNYFSLSDAHITDKESPANDTYFGWASPYQGGLITAYSPIILSTTQVLDAAVQTIDALNRQTPFDFGIFMGDAANNTQLNELRWFIDVMDGNYVTPSSGAHLGADIIDYQRPYQASGLTPTIPWYAVIGNHDQFWMGFSQVTDKVRLAEAGSAILNMGTNPEAPNPTEGTGMYVGVVDGTTQYGNVIYGGPTATFVPPYPSVAADPTRLSLTTPGDTTTNYIDQFFDYSTSLPAGHGFDRSHTGSLAACYSFIPKAGIPLKIIVLDDTCKTTSPSAGANFYADGWMDDERLEWLTDELQAGQNANQLMIIAAHCPVNPQTDIYNNTPNPMFYVDPSDPDANITDAQFVALLQQYPNLIMFMAGHRHMNTVTPHPSSDQAHPEYGFWEVETPSTRDFPQQFRTFDIRRNADNTISIITTDVDPAETTGSVAANSRGYAIGAARLCGSIAIGDTTSHSYNAELIKQLTPQMQTVIANCGTPIR